MATEAHGLPPRLVRMAADISRIAAWLATDETTREDLRQEMLCYLLTLPDHRPRRFYLRALGARAHNYWARSVLDAPMKKTGKVLLDRQTVYVGGLHELDALHQQQAA